MTDADRARVAEIQRAHDLDAYDDLPSLAPRAVRDLLKEIARLREVSSEALRHAGEAYAMGFRDAEKVERERLREAIQALAASCGRCGGRGWVVIRDATYAEADWHRVECECRRYLEALKDG